MSRSGTLQVVAQGERDLVITRTFNAPRDLVFEAWTTPALLKRWLSGLDGWSLAVCDVDLRVGGKYRYVWRHDESGATMGMGGVFLEIEAPERLVSTERFDDAWYPGEAIGTVVLVERDGRTHLTQTMTYQSAEARDGVMKSPMESGLAESFDRLEKVVETKAVRS